MQFKTLEEKCLYYRDLTDHRLVPGLYTIIMLDGRSFSKKVKNKFKKPFDDFFVKAMNETASYLCTQIQGCRIGYVQSDEISLLIRDWLDTGESGSSFFEYRLCKLNSICASLATSKFNRLMWENGHSDLYEFDCKAWNVPNQNDAYAWFLYRQNECGRNARQQVAQTWLKHKDLQGLKAEEQIQKLKEKEGIDFYSLDLGLQQGRFCYKVEVEKTSPKYGTYMRSEWPIFSDIDLKTEDGRLRFLEKL